jgi:hydrogenase nickel incorporation protein HypA/HybF
MHEFGLAEGVLDAVRRRAAGRKVAAIRVRFGVRHAVDEESLGQAFGMLAEGTEAAGAAVELVTVPARITCPGCGFTGETTDLLAACPRCSADDLAVTGGDEMVLESVRYLPTPPLSTWAGTQRSGTLPQPRPVMLECMLMHLPPAGPGKFQASGNPQCTIVH